MSWLSALGVVSHVRLLRGMGHDLRLIVDLSRQLDEKYFFRIHDQFFFFWPKEKKRASNAGLIGPFTYGFVEADDIVAAACIGGLAISYFIIFIAVGVALAFMTFMLFLLPGVAIQNFGKIHLFAWLIWAIGFSLFKLDLARTKKKNGMKDLFEAFDAISVKKI